MEHLKITIAILALALAANGAVFQCADQNAVVQTQGFDCQTCSNYDRVRCALKNETKCYCKSGYVKNSEGKCTLIEDCPLNCPENEQSNNCAASVQPTCQKPTVGIVDRRCVRTCVCSPGYIRQTTQGPCIEPDLCPKNCTLPHEVYNECISPCAPTCQDPEPTGPCPLYCILGCGCKSPYIRDKVSGECFLRRNCPVYSS